MRIRTGTIYTATSSAEVSLTYQCSSCGKEVNASTYVVSEATNTVNLIGLSSDKDFKMHAQDGLIRKLMMLQSTYPEKRYTEARFECSCRSCGHKEPWARLKHPIAQKISGFALVPFLFFTLSMVVMLFNGKLFAPGAMVMWLIYFGIAALFIGPIAYSKIHNSKMLERTKTLPESAQPQVSVRIGKQYVPLMPPKELRDGQWVCKECGIVNDKEKRRCVYCYPPQ